MQRKKEAGYAVGNDAPYGYIRNPVTKRNEIDPEAAFYVQLIFQWELMGVPIFEIARRMTLLQVPTPREWHRKMVEGKEVLTCKKWGVTTIRHILENQTYVGDTINNKSTQKLFAGQDKRDLPKEQWYVAKNTHPAIIARDDFEKVQKILNKNRAVFQTVRAKSEQIRAEYQNDLAGMVFCADCGRQMEFERLPHGAEESKKVCYYICKARQADDKGNIAQGNVFYYPAFTECAQEHLSELKHYMIEMYETLQPLHRGSSAQGFHWSYPCRCRRR